MRNSATTIKDISRALCISTATVSRALRGAYDVSLETKEKVRDKAKELNYIPNYNAVRLSSGRMSTNTIGVIFPLITNYYFSTVFTGIQKVAYENGFNVLVFLSHDSCEEEISVLEKFPISSVDGMIVSTCSNKKSFQYYSNIINNHHKPIVFFDRAVDGLSTSKVLQDDYSGAVKAVEHLIDCGYKKIAHISGPVGLDLTRRRKSGYLDTMKRNNLKVCKNWMIHSDFSEESGVQDTLMLLDSGDAPDAIFAVNDRKAIGVIKALKMRGIKIGEEFGVIGFTNSPASSTITPSLTTIAEPAFQVGTKSADLILSHIQNKDFQPLRIVLSCDLIPRDSTLKKKHANQ